MTLRDVPSPATSLPVRSACLYVWLGQARMACPAAAAKACACMHLISLVMPASLHEGGQTSPVGLACWLLAQCTKQGRKPEGSPKLFSAASAQSILQAASRDPLVNVMGPVNTRSRRQECNIFTSSRLIFSGAHSTCKANVLYKTYTIYCTKSVVNQMHKIMSNAQPWKPTPDQLVRSNHPRIASPFKLACTPFADRFRVLGQQRVACS